MVSKFTIVWLIGLAIIGTSFLQGVNTGASAELVRQMRVAFVIAIQGTLLAVLATCFGHSLTFRPSASGFSLTLYILTCGFSLAGHPEWLFGTWKIFEFLMYVLWAYTASLLLRDRLVDVSQIGLNTLLTLVTAGVVLSIFVAPEIAWNTLPSIIPYQLRGGFLPINSNDLAMILLTGIIYTSFAVARAFPRRLFVLVLLALLVATQNRTAVVYLMAFALFNSKFGWPVALIGLIALGTDQSIISTMGDAITRGDISNILTGNGRVIIWTSVLPEVKNAILLGYGFYVGHRFFSLSGGQFNLENVNTYDNTFLDILFDTGIIGLTAFILFIFSVGYRLYGTRLECLPRYYVRFMRWLAPFFLVDAVMGPTVQTFGLNLTVYTFAFLPVFTRPATKPAVGAIMTGRSDYLAESGEKR